MPVFLLVGSTTYNSLSEVQLNTTFSWKGYRNLTSPFHGNHIAGKMKGHVLELSAKQIELEATSFTPTFYFEKFQI